MKNKKTVLIFLLSICIAGLSAQTYSNKFDLKIGTGLGFMGWGDRITMGFENELNYKVNNYFTAAIGIGTGRSINNAEGQNDYLQGSISVFISPFKNNGRNNFRIGGGYTYINETTTYIGMIYYVPYYSIRYTYATQSHNAFNIIVENEYRINARFLIGVKAFTTGRIDGGILSGGMVKLGVAL
ncbi:hypothetical protein FACS189429_8010 [Bacteroidia bacterium]|nr:hypothetical protein FACS189429_8010 [Bacteroidia bacterium]